MRNDSMTTGKGPPYVASANLASTFTATTVHRYNRLFYVPILHASHGLRPRTLSEQLAASPRRYTPHISHPPTRVASTGRRRSRRASPSRLPPATGTDLLRAGSGYYNYAIPTSLGREKVSSLRSAICLLAAEMCLGGRAGASRQRAAAVPRRGARAENNCPRARNGRRRATARRDYPW